MKSGARYILAAVVIFVIATVAISLGVVGARHSQSPAGNNPSPGQVKAALRRGGIREAAKLKKHYVDTFDPNWDWVQLDTEGLTKNSLAVVTGIPMTSSTQLSSDGQLVTTSYTVAVQEVIKGDISPASSINVSLPGGIIEFGDGTSAEMKTPGFDKMENGRTYLLFLSEDTPNSGSLVLTAGPQGLFEIPADRKTVKAHGRQTDPATKESKNLSADTFLNNVRQQAAKWPKPGHCCGQD